MNVFYPTALPDLPEWARRHSFPLAEARVRFVQYVILEAIASSNDLREMLVFKGGNALDFIWQPNRSTRDLDFSADLTKSVINLDATVLKRRFELALIPVARRHDLALKVQSVRPPTVSEGKTFTTYEIHVGYALPDERMLRLRMQEGKDSTHYIPVEVSLNEAICADDWLAIDGARKLRVSTKEDILSEKLRALLQQEIRNRIRSQDLLDIVVMLRNNPNIDAHLVTQFLLRKAAARDVPVSKLAFHSEELARRARQEYDHLADTARITFIPFDEAMPELLAFTDALDLP